MANATIATKYGTAPRNTWTGVEKIPLDVSGADGVGLASTLKTYVNTGQAPLSAIRTKLNADTTFYIATTGNDATGDGSSGAPWASPQHAWDYVCLNIDTQGHMITFQCAAGTYTPLVVGDPVLEMSNDYYPVPASYIVWTGQPTRTLVRWSNPDTASGCVVSVGNSMHVEFDNIQMFSNAAGPQKVFGGDGIGSNFSLTNCDFGPAGGAHIYAGDYCHIAISGTYSVTGGAPYHIITGLQGSVHFSSPAIVFPSAITFSQEFALVSQRAILWWFPGTITNPGNVTGKQFFVDTGGFIYSSFYGYSTIPGTIPGTFGAISQGHEVLSSIGYGHLGGINSKAGLPTTSEITMSGLWGLWKNTTDSRVYLAVNDGGTIKKVELV